MHRKLFYYPVLVFAIVFMFVGCDCAEDSSAPAPSPLSPDTILVDEGYYVYEQPQPFELTSFSDSIGLTTNAHKSIADLAILDLEPSRLIWANVLLKAATELRTTGVSYYEHYWIPNLALKQDGSNYVVVADRRVPVVATKQLQFDRTADAVFLRAVKDDRGFSIKNFNLEGFSNSALFLANESGVVREIEHIQELPKNPYMLILFEGDFATAKVAFVRFIMDNDGVSCWGEVYSMVVPDVSTAFPKGPERW